MEPKNGSLKDDLPFQLGDFLIGSMLIFRGVCVVLIGSCLNPVSHWENNTHYFSKGPFINLHFPTYMFGSMPILMFEGMLFVSFTVTLGSVVLELFHLFSV